MVKFIITVCLLLSTAVEAAEAKPTKIVLTEDNVVYFGSRFTFRSVAELQTNIADKDARLPSHKPLYIVIDSGGGSIAAGLEAITNIASYKRKIHTITLFGASMAFQTVQGLGKRYITNSGTLMSHKARGGFQGEFPGQLDSRYNFWLRKLTALDSVTVARSKGVLTLETYRKMYENEYWCDGIDCVNSGVADEVAQVTCDESLSGDSTTEIKRMYMGRRITLAVVKASCPLVTGISSYSATIDGVDIFEAQDRWSNGGAATKEEVQAIYDYIQTLIRKPPMPSRVIYMNVPASSGNIEPTN